MAWRSRRPARENPSGRWSRIDVVLVAVVCAVTLWRVLPAIDETRFHRDEARWLHGAQLLRAWADPLGERWQDEGYPDLYGTVDERNRRRAQPPLAMYVLGIGVLVQRGHLPDNGYWIMTQDGRWNREHGNRPEDGDVFAGRRADALIAVLTAAGLYVLGALLTNRAGALATGLVFAVHPLVRDTASRAWADPLLALCVVLAALAGYRLAERPTPGRAALFGALLGLGGATKLSPLVVAVAAGAAGSALLAWQLLRRAGFTPITRLGLGLLAAPLVAFAVFVASYPYLWPDPVGHTGRMLEFRADSFRMQAANIPEAKVEDVADAAGYVGAELGSSFSGGGLIENRIGGGAWLRNADLGIAVAGWLLFVALMLPRGRIPARLLASSTIAAQAGIVVVAMGVAYPRYLLPVVLAVAVGNGLAVGWLARARAAPAPPPSGATV